MPRRAIDKRSSSTSPRARSQPGVRIQKVLAEAGVESRRNCERLIEEGRVTVNGKQVMALPCFVDPAQDRIAVDGKVIAAIHESTRTKNQLHLLFNKPPDVLCEPDTIMGRKSVFDLIDTGDTTPRRLHCACPMPHEASGILILTTDSAFAEQLTHARYGVPKSWEIKVKGIVTQTELSGLTSGFQRIIDARKRGQGRTGGGDSRRGGVRPRSHRAASNGPRGAADKAKSAIELSIDRATVSSTFLICITAAAMDDAVAMLFKSADHPVRHLRRLSIGPINLKGIAIGSGRALTGRELKQLQALVRNN